eukprot:8620518-Pyramimonas_sp.AAC.1
MSTFDRSKDRRVRDEGSREVRRGSRGGSEGCKRVRISSIPVRDTGQHPVECWSPDGSRGNPDSGWDPEGFRLESRGDRHLIELPINCT